MAGLSAPVDLGGFPLAHQIWQPRVWSGLAWRTSPRASLISSSLNRWMTASIVFHEVLAMVALGGSRYQLRMRCFTLTDCFAVPRATDKVAMMSLRLMMPRR